MQLVSMAKKSHVEPRPLLFVLLADLRSTRLATRTPQAIVDSAGKVMTQCASGRFRSSSPLAGLVHLRRLCIHQPDRQSTLRTLRTEASGRQAPVIGTGVIVFTE
ncbi:MULTISPECIES: hypothetical protein [Burkholderia]|jgi:hypothetical protein|uniref:Uncharacterized protein n=2 Tax=Burkholderia contaminans TaxID=488447 RepID=A0AAP1YEY5_9BURK|nr:MULTISPECIES: hypothetical protein [Burkholderia]MBN3732430.1 hypothetical protein [Burkholderia sp. Tr-20390]UTP22108.1 hypothetical protein NMB33_17510 [Burkholderia sp. FXe9]MBH9694729.1 hypothetical protein [Burkholderia contaminans]MBK1906254.1 hypothetical protein [Burkholderia contaminans]MBK1914307.1 hypothetical protein [Burkholderia contaminans]